MSDQLEVLKTITRAFDAAQVSYLLTGSIAAGFYGQPRMTRDIDLVAVLYPQHVPRLVALLREAFIVDEAAMRAAISDAGSVHLLHRAALQKVDVIVRTAEDYELEKFERRRRVDIEGTPVWIISPEDLVLSKLVWAKDSRSELQLRDVRSVIAVQPALDWRYIEQWARRLTVAGLLAEIRGS